MTSDATQFLSLRVIIVLFQLTITCLKPNITIKKKKIKTKPKKQTTKEAWKMFKVNDTETRMKPMTSFFCLYC